MKTIGTYKNGNYCVYMFDDGTKVRVTSEDSFIPDKPESIDIKITDYCDIGCPMCHENSSINGKHADLSNIAFLKTLRPYSELAIGGGNPLSHPHLLGFLEKCKERGIIANMTVNQKHFIENFQLLLELQSRGLVHGIGVSVTSVDSKGVLSLLSALSNAVVHVINGVIPIDELRKLYDHDLRLLILGYKDFRRGAYAHTAKTDRRMEEMHKELPVVFEKFKVVSFDNLALKQLKVRDFVSKDEWENYYMGDDGQFTMYIDLVNREFAKSSTSTIRWSLTDDIHDMFAQVRNSSGW